ncbi:MAG: YcxB family protein [Acidobacteriota bacterium]
MEDLKVKSSTLPSRCEICHQSDLFDPLNGKCIRCSNLQNEIYSADGRFEITYSLTANDHFQFVVYHLFRRLSTQLFFGCSLIYSIYMVYSSIETEFFLVKLITSIIVTVLWFLPFIGLMLIIFYFQAKSKKNKTRITKYKLIVSDKFIIEESEYKRDQYNWNAIQKISQNKKYIFIFDSGSSAILIPKRFFRDQIQENQFIELINSYWNKNKMANERA